jgi:uncharacterized membrane protein
VPDPPDATIYEMEGQTDQPSPTQEIRKRQFHVRTLLIAMLVCAPLFAAWKSWRYMLLFGLVFVHLWSALAPIVIVSVAVVLGTVDRKQLRLPNNKVTRFLFMSQILSLMAVFVIWLCIVLFSAWR